MVFGTVCLKPVADTGLVCCAKMPGQKNAFSAEPSATTRIAFT